METIESVLKTQIRATGPMDIGTYMATVLGHPKLGYYITRDPIGKDGDFTTAPEISQMFGEMITVCIIDAWMRAGQPDVHLVELGPGRGTLMADILRCCKNAWQFFERSHIHLVETSPALRAVQKDKLSGHDLMWHDSIETLPDDAPLVIIANEFFDALPIRQAVMGPRGWQERVVGLDGDALVFGTKPLPPIGSLGALPVAQEGTVFEFSPVRENVMQTLSERLQKQGGMMLAIDYGHAVKDAMGDTFQAVRKHTFCSPLEHVGNADLTSHVDFTRLSAIAETAGCVVQGPVTQKAFLENIGIGARLEALQKLNPGNTDLAAGVERLTKDGDMGTLFKVLGVAGNVSFCRFLLPGFQTTS